MKKLLFIISILALFLVTAGIADARVFLRFGFGWPFVIGPRVVAAPPPVYYSYPYYGPGYYGYRVWVPGYWSRTWTGYGWERVWHPGHWEYQP